MMAQHLRRTGALLVSAVLLASLAAALVAAPASAAKPKCAGKTATIVGTNKGEVIKGTQKADVIVARGGHDRIYGLGGDDTICGGPGNDRILGAAGNDLLLGQVGRDKLFGGAGRDRLLGGPADDRLAGGPGNDACLQGSGVGLRIGCERPALVPVPVPVPPPAGPTLIPLPGVLVIAYSDIDGLDGYSTGDVMISKILDTNSDGVVSKDDTIKMGRYPKNTHPGPGDFADWTETSHVIDEVFYADQTEVLVTTTIGATHGWWADSPDPNEYDEYSEWLMGLSDFEDKKGPDLIDSVEVQADSPSRPVTAIPDVSGEGPNDDPFIDVELLYLVSP